MGISNSTGWRARLAHIECLSNVLSGVLRERGSWSVVARFAEVNQAFLANGEIAGTRTALPFNFTVFDQGQLKVLAQVARCAPRHCIDLVIDLSRAHGQWFDLAELITDQRDLGVEAERGNLHRNGQCFVWVPGAENRVDSHAEGRVFGEKLEFTAKRAQRLDGCLVGFDVVNADLEREQTGLVEPENSLPWQGANEEPLDD